MKIRLVEIDDNGIKRWKIEEQWSRSLGVWENYFSPKEITYLSYESAKKDYDDILSGKIRGNSIVLHEDEVK